MKEMSESIKRMTDGIVSILDGNVCGIWLYGSVVLNDFHPGWSDIDFVALSEAEISVSQAERLLTLRQDMLEREPDDPYYRCFEGVIAYLDEYRNRSFERLVYWGTGGQRITDRYVPDAFSLFVLAKYSRNIYSDAEWILPAPDRAELIKAVCDHYDAIRRYAAETDDALYSCGWLLDIARCVYTLRYNDVTAKTKAGEWALAEQIFPDEEALRKTLKIRRDPSAFKDDADLGPWLKSLGPVVQRYADVLEQELQKACGHNKEAIWE